VSDKYFVSSLARLHRALLPKHRPTLQQAR
jgi:hypothetical protein